MSQNFVCLYYTSANIGSYKYEPKARFRVTDITQMNKPVVYFTVTHNVKFCVPNAHPYTKIDVTTSLRFLNNAYPYNKIVVKSGLRFLNNANPYTRIDVKPGLRFLNNYVSVLQPLHVCIPEYILLRRMVFL